MPVVVTDPSAGAPEPISDGRFAHGEVITVVNRVKSGSDREGNDVFTDSSQGYIGAFSPAVGFESTTLQDQVSSQPAVYLPFVAVVSSSSRVFARGDEYEVDGVPEYWANPHSGDKPGVQVPLKRVSG